MNAGSGCPWRLCWVRSSVGPVVPGGSAGSGPPWARLSLAALLGPVLRGPGCCRRFADTVCERCRSLQIFWPCVFGAARVSRREAENLGAELLLSPLCDAASGCCFSVCATQQVLEVQPCLKEDSKSHLGHTNGLKGSADSASVVAAFASRGHRWRQVHSLADLLW